MIFEQNLLESLGQGTFVEGKTGFTQEELFRNLNFELASSLTLLQLKKRKKKKKKDIPSRNSRSTLKNDLFAFVNFSSLIPSFVSICSNFNFEKELEIAQFKQETADSFFVIASTFQLVSTREEELEEDSRKWNVEQESIFIGNKAICLQKLRHVKNHFLFLRWRIVYIILATNFYLEISWIYCEIITLIEGRKFGKFGKSNLLSANKILLNNIFNCTIIILLYYYIKYNHKN